MMHNSRKLLAVLAMAAVLVGGVNSARILAIFPSPSRSHIISFEALTRELAARGHQLIVISSYPQEKSLANYTDIAVPLNRLGMDKNMFEMKMTDMLKSMTTIGSDLCEHYLNDPGVQKLIHSTDEHFDLILIGIMFNECLLGFVHKFQAPYISMASNGGMPQMFELVGNPNHYAYVPNVIHSFTDRMTFIERMKNSFSSTVMKSIKDYLLMPQHDAKMREYFAELEPIPYISELERKTSLLFLNNHFSIGFPRPLMPNVIEVGGMHIKAPKKLPKDIQMFVDGAKHGVIYFSLGSNVKASHMTEEKREAFVKVFSQLKQKVLWKSDMDTIEGLSPNVMLGKWLPQSDILAHDNVKLFISHGGLLSTQEAIYRQVPIVGIPVFGDQQMNIKNAQTAGYAINLDYQNVTSESLTWALETVLNEPSYQENVKKLSTLFRDQPSTALETAVFWTEYIIRHKGANHLRSAVMDLAWYQYFLLDVMALFVLVLTVASLVMLKLAKTFAQKMSRRSACSEKSISMAGKKNK